MKIITNVLVLLVLSATAFSQEKSDKLLLKKYSEAELQQLKDDSVHDYNFEAYAAENALEFAALPTGKSQEFELIDMPKKTDSYIDLGLEIKDLNQYFKIKGTNKLLVVKSRWVLTNEMKNK